MFSVFAITGRALRGEIVRDRGRREVGATNGRRRVCTEITLNVPEPSALDRRSQCSEGKALLRIKILCQHNKCKAKSNFAVMLTVGAKLHSDHRNASFAAILTVGAKFVFRGNARRRRSGGKIGKCNLTKGRIGGIIGAYGTFAVRLYAIYE